MGYLSPHLCFLVCEYLYPEMKAAIEAEDGADIDVRAFAARCGRPPICWEDIRETVEESDADLIEVFGCHCLEKLKIPKADVSRCIMTQQEQCFHLLCSQSLVSSLQQKGAYVLSPGWLAHWKQHIADWGFDRETGPAFLGQSLRKLVLLDTGTDERCQEHLKDFSSFLELPCETLAIGLEFHSLALADIVARYQFQELKRENEKNVRKAADSAMAMDLLGRVSRASSEAEVVDSIVQLFSMLLAPEKVLHVRVTTTGLQLDQVAGITSTEQQCIKDFYGTSRKEYQVNRKGDSFLLRVGRSGKESAVLSVQHVAFPQYMKHYLNVALSISRVCALAIEHARTVEELLNTSRLAGKAEVATEVLHNVGNTLNSISVSSEHICELVQKSSCSTMSGVVALIDQHAETVGEFFSNDPRGKQIPLYFAKLSEQLAEEQAAVLREGKHQLKNIRLAAEIIRTRQDAAKEGALLEQIDFPAILEECLHIFKPQIKEKQIDLRRDYKRLPATYGQRHKIVQVINNLIANAVDALEDVDQEERAVLLRLYPEDEDEGSVVLEVHDNGVGMDKDTLQRVFIFGFSTKSDGHGFGLHNAANLATEMNGSLVAESSGKGCGSIFRLRLPIEK